MFDIVVDFLSADSFGSGESFPLVSVFAGDEMTLHHLSSQVNTYFYFFKK